jgi:hypothetical protein
VDEAPGWDAIDAAIRPFVGDREPRHWATGTGLPDQDGLWGISAYRRTDHWFFVTYGLSELFQKVWEDPQVSGWGEELTLRLALDGDDGPPEWGAKLLARLGTLVFQRAIRYAPGGRQQFGDARGDIPAAVCFAADPELPDPIATVHGTFTFVATVPISEGMLEAMRRASTSEVLDQVRRDNPLLIAGGPGLER